jgi:hypothetical protein
MATFSLACKINCFKRRIKHCRLHPLICLRS